MNKDVTPAGRGEETSFELDKGGHDDSGLLGSQQWVGTGVLVKSGSAVHMATAGQHMACRLRVQAEGTSGP